MRRALLTAFLILPALGLTAAPAVAAPAPAPAAPAPAVAASAVAARLVAPAAVHHWLMWPYSRIRLTGTWSQNSKGLVVTAYMRDYRKDGRWVRIEFEDTSASGKALDETYFYFNGGKRIYTGSKMRHTTSFQVAHSLVHLCLLKRVQGKALHCGAWHRIF